MFRIAFDPDRPVYATSAFTDGTVAAGGVFDWRAKGLQAIDALAMFRSGLLTHSSPPSVAPAALPAATAQAAAGGSVSEAAPEVVAEAVWAEVAKPASPRRGRSR